MGFSLMSWNVEKFDGEQAQLQEVASHIFNLDGNNNTEPDVIGLFEVENVNIIELVRVHLPNYNYFLTDGPQNKEILVGVRNNKFKQTTFTQKREFKAYNPYLRPGALLTLEDLNDILYNILFLHTDSGTEAKDFGNRFEMMGKIQSLKKSIDRIANDLRKESKLIVLGDLNTMGLFFPTRHNYNRKVTQEEEISAIQKDAENQDMSILFKELSTTWTNGNKESDLDHIIASTNIHFNQFGQRENKPFFVKVTGWAQLAGQAKTNFVENISDHCSLYCEII